MNIIARHPEGCYPSALFNWDRVPHYFKVGLFLNIYGRTIYLGLRLRWLKQDRPIRLLIKYYNDSAKQNRLDNEFIQDVHRVYLTSEMLADMNLTNDQFERIKLSPNSRIKGE